MQTQLRWYLENRHVIVSPLDQFVLCYTEEGIETMPSTTRHQLVQNLERLERVFAVEQRARAMGQGTIRSLFGVRQGVPTANVEETAEIEQGDHTNSTETM